MMKQFLSNRSGATAIEYGFICALIVLAAIVGMSLLGNQTEDYYGNISDNVHDAMK